MTVLLVAIGGAVGANLRYLLDRRVQRFSNADFPWGTLTVNVLGSAVLGFLTALSLSHAQAGTVLAVLGTGLCGSLTTFSTFGYETVRLFGEGARLHAVTNVAVTVLAGFAAAGTGILTATLL